MHGIALLAVAYGPTAAAFLVFALWEFWLGRTDKVKANSTLALIGLAFAKRASLVARDYLGTTAQGRVLVGVVESEEVTTNTTTTTQLISMPKPSEPPKGAA